MMKRLETATPHSPPESLPAPPQNGTTTGQLLSHLKAHLPQKLSSLHVESGPHLILKGGHYKNSLRDVKTSPGTTEKWVAGGK